MRLRRCEHSRTRRPDLCRGTNVPNPRARPGTNGDNENRKRVASRSAFPLSAIPFETATGPLFLCSWANFEQEAGLGSVLSGNVLAPKEMFRSREIGYQRDCAGAKNVTAQLV